MSSLRCNNDKAFDVILNHNDDHQWRRLKDALYPRWSLAVALITFLRLALLAKVTASCSLPVPMACCFENYRFQIGWLREVHIVMCYQVALNAILYGWPSHLESHHCAPDVSLRMIDGSQEMLAGRKDAWAYMPSSSSEPLVAPNRRYQQQIKTPLSRLRDRTNEEPLKGFAIEFRLASCQPVISPP